MKGVQITDTSSSIEKHFFLPFQGAPRQQCWGLLWGNLYVMQANQVLDD